MPRIPQNEKSRNSALLIAPRHHMALSAIALSLALCAQADDSDAKPVREQLACPNPFPAQTNSPHSGADRWRAHHTGDLAPIAAGFSQDEPAHAAQLKPDSTARSKTTVTLTWHFEGPYPKGKWLTCAYPGNWTLSRRIDEATESCQITYAISGKSPAMTVDTITCDRPAAAQ